MTDVAVLDFDVVAIEGKGVYITDGEHCWHVGGPSKLDDGKNKLHDAYVDAVDA